MQHQKHQSEKKTLDLFLANFKQAHDEPRPNQLLVLQKMPDSNKMLVQAPTGTGKTSLGYAFLKTNAAGKNGFFVCPNKTLVDNVVTLYPQVSAVYGRNEYDCLYYVDSYKADQVPCGLLKECPHRVNLETGETYEQGVKPCPYFQAKYLSRKSEIVACTTHYYFYEALGRKEMPEAIVIDEVHKWANSIRSMLHYNITDTSLEQFWELLCSIECRTEAKHIRDFSDTMIRILRNYESGSRTQLLQDDDLRELLKILLKIKRERIDEKIKKAIKEKRVNPVSDRELLKALDEFTGALYRYVKSLEFALEGKEKKPLSYVFGFWNSEKVDDRKSQYILTIKSYAIAGLTRTKLLPEKYMAMSATIGRDPSILSRDTGIDGDFVDLESDFPLSHTKIFMPKDVPDLSIKGMSRNDKNRTIRKMLRGVSIGKQNGIRSLIIVVSDEERNQCIKFAAEEGVVVTSYNENFSAREAVRKFREGHGDVLIGTEAQYGEGIDLPDGAAGFTFYLRPGYPGPADPQAQFEEKRFGNMRWALWTWRVITKMLQARGRTIRSVNDKGCIFLMSQQFRRFTFGGLPKWLQSAYKSEITFDQAVQEGIKLFKK
ncbi:MAG: helicase C-terminal domain-containing protein [bacterium]